MKLTINDFEGYDNSCETIKKIKLWIENKGGSFDMKELISEFEKEHYSFKTEVIRYIKPDYLKEYLDEFFVDSSNKNLWLELVYIKKTIERKAQEFGGVLLTEELLKKKYELEREYENKNFYLNKEIEKYKGFNNMEELLELNQKLKTGYNYKEGTVLQVLNYFFNQSFQFQSYQTTNSVMQSVLYNLCQVAVFDEDDFSELMRDFNFGLWGGNLIESFYRSMVLSNNNSAWKSFEKALSRTPFLLKNKRMYEGMTFRLAENNKWIYYRCTGWNNDKKIKFVTDKTEKQNRFSFDNKEFRAFFKDKKIEF